jgi:alkylation response protein AidB-like acyl-CoA dehydrogenase/nitroreductase/NAD-dependent dihydropyrimidine dehydrogenase PreA subunit
MGLRDLNIDLNQEHVVIWNSTKKFAQNVMRPAAIELDKLADPADVIAKDSIYWDWLRQTFELGYHGLLFPKAIGGMEADPLTYALVTEVMGWAASDLAVSFGCHTQPYFWATMSPDPEMQDLARQFMEDKGTMTGCWAITEPNHGSDSLRFGGEYGAVPEMASEVRAAKDGDYYVINGQKSAWVSNGTIAKYAVLWLSLDPSRGNDGGGVAVLPLNLPGISRGKPLNKLGQRALNQGEIYFDNVRIPKKCMIAADPATFQMFSNMELAICNGWMGLCFIGLAQAALEESLAYAKSRVQGGKIIYEHQNIRLKLFDMWASIEAARSLARRVAIYNTDLFLKGQPLAVHYAMATKVLSTETAFRAASEGVQIFGGYGLSKEYHIEKLFRDARAAMIEDGTNETLAIDGAERLGKGRLILDVKLGTAPVAQAAEGQPAGPTFEEFMPILRPTGTHMGLMKADPEKCTSCGLCSLNCPFKCWEADGNKIPRMKEGSHCFSCFNCMVACPADAISIVEPFHVDEGVFFDVGFPELKMPLPPQNAEGKSTEWTTVEKTIMERRSVRNFKPDPVPEPLIRRVLEAGRFAPSAGNQQPWKFLVVTDRDVIGKMEEGIYGLMNVMNTMYHNDTMVMSLVASMGQPTPLGTFEPRVQGGMASVIDKELPIFLGAPAVIFLASNDRLLSPQLHAGICGQNMNLAAQALGLGACWTGFGACAELVPEIKKSLGLEEPWRIQAVLVLGYPKFKQEGIVPRQFRPVSWIRPGAKGLETD